MKWWWSGHTSGYSQAPREEGGMWELASPGAVIYGQESGLMSSAEVRSTVEPRAVGSLTHVRVSVCDSGSKAEGASAYFFNINFYWSVVDVRASLIAQLVKNLPVMQETPV